MKNSPAKQHFVPKVYLKNFACNQNGEIYRLKIKSIDGFNKIRTTNISSICYKIDFYTIETTDLLTRRNLNDNYVLEKKGFEYENEGFKKKLDKAVKGNSFTTSEAYDFLSYLINIKDRNPRTRELISQKWLKEDLNNRLNNAESLLAFNSVGCTYAYDESKEFLVWLRVEALKFIEDEKNFSDIHRDALLDSYLGREDKHKINTIKKLLRHQFIVYKTTSDYPFVMSDNPIFAMKFPNQIEHIEYDSFDFLGFPLNSESMLVLRRDKVDAYDLIFKPIICVNAEKEFVDKVNEAAIINCIEYIFSNRKDMLERLKNKFSHIP